jgi:hypothetical protein
MDDRYGDETASTEWWQELGLSEAPSDFVKTRVSFDTEKLQKVLELLSELPTTKKSA